MQGEAKKVGHRWIRHSVVTIINWTSYLRIRRVGRRLLPRRVKQLVHGDVTAVNRIPAIGAFHLVAALLESPVTDTRDGDMRKVEA